MIREHIERAKQHDIDRCPTIMDILQQGVEIKFKKKGILKTINNNQLQFKIHNTNELLIINKEPKELLLLMYNYGL